ncbi:MAG: hypothetical protein AB7N91_22655 [Candidatus Tectimicrobiota bacterium]
MTPTHRIWIAWTLLLNLAWTAPVRADLFARARSATDVSLGQADTSGVTVRGGVNLRTYLGGQTPTLFQTQVNVGGSCGAFDFAASLQQAFGEIPALFEGLIQAILANMPMLILCYASPTLCDLAKHFQSLVNTVIQARYAQCQSIQTAMAAAGLKLRGGQAAQCLEDAQQAGTSLHTALQRCLGSVQQLRSPLGNRTGRVELVKETLQAAGADATTVALARNLLGEVTLTAGGATLGAQQQRPPSSLHARYEQLQTDTATRLRQAAATIATGGTPPQAVWQELSLPGQPLPRAVLEALAALQTDPVRHESYLQKLATGLAIVRLTWEVRELHDQLAAAETVNAQLNDEQRHVLERRLATLQQELARVVQEKETAEKHVLPVLEELLREHAAVQHEATRVGLQVPSAPAPPPTPFRGQVPGGYGY